MRNRVHIGTSGWSYKHWKGLYYPEKLPSTRWLSFYAGDFDTTEVNSSFYRIPSSTTVEKWMAQVPEHFRFSPKISRFLTHMKKLNDPEASLENFFSVFAPMKKMMGPVLVQLPPFLAFDHGKALYFFELLQKQYRGYEFVLEVRHDSWMQEASLSLMKKFQVGLVISQSGVFFPYSERITEKNIYLRFHGPGELYASPYSDQMLEYFAELFYKWLREGHEIWAYFNNDIGGHAPEDAKKLMMLMEL